MNLIVNTQFTVTTQQYKLNVCNLWCVIPGMWSSVATSWKTAASRLSASRSSTLAPLPLCFIWCAWYVNRPRIFPLFLDSSWKVRNKKKVNQTSDVMIQYEHLNHNITRSKSGCRRGGDQYLSDLKVLNARTGSYLSAEATAQSRLGSLRRWTALGLPGLIFFRMIRGLIQWRLPCTWFHHLSDPERSRRRP